MATCKECFHYQSCKGTYYEVKEQGEFDGEMYAECGCDDFLPSADVKEVRHGEWIIDNSVKERSFYEVNYKVLITCNICGSRHFLGLQPYPIFSQKELKDDAYRKYRYCGECGAKMDGGKEE